MNTLTLSNGIMQVWSAYPNFEGWPRLNIAGIYIYGLNVRYTSSEFSEAIFSSETSPGGIADSENTRT